MFELPIGFAIGLALGLLGGGGSILTVPALVYVSGQNPRAAVTASLMIVGVNSLSGVAAHRAQGTLNWRVALAFGGAGMAMAFLAARASKLFASSTLMLLFAGLMLVVAGFMLFSRTSDAQRKERGLPMTLAAGAVVGTLTGFLGVGGGFLIVPALVMLVGLPMRHAVGTSLMIIVMNSAAGLLGHLGEPIDLIVVLTFAAAGIAGALAGTWLGRRVQAQRLKQAFAVFVVALAIFLLTDTLTKLG